MLDGLRRKTKRTARSVALGSAGGVLVLAGLGLWAGAGYLVLAPLLGPASALFVVGATILGLGLIALGFAGSPTQFSDDAAGGTEAHAAQQVASPDPRQEPTMAVMAAFMNGLAQGAAQRRAP